MNDFENLFLMAERKLCALKSHKINDLVPEKLVIVVSDALFDENLPPSPAS